MGVRQDILECNDLLRKEVEVKQWKCTVTIQELGFQEAMRAYADLNINEDGTVDLTWLEMSRMVAFGVIDPKTGERVFSDEDIPKLSRKSRPALRMLYEEVVKLTGTVEDEVKN